MIHMVVFDMAGTTINEDNIVYKTIATSFMKHGIEVSLATVLQHGAGKEKRMAIRDILAVVAEESSSDRLIDAIYHTFQYGLESSYAAAPISVFPELATVLARLREWEIAIVFNTGYTHEMASFLLDKVGILIGRDIDLLVTADQVSHSRPAGDMITLACDILQIAPTATIKIGDSGIDILEGRNAGVATTIGITTGAQDRATLLAYEPDLIIDSLIEILPLIAEMKA